METIYEIFIKGWGEYEDAWYPHNRGTDIETLKKKVFEDWDTEAEYYIKVKSTGNIVEEGFINEGENDE
tara:strand:+ start:18735 stop:18941 length:207 start_codon:yes stop_codon:yes gene_type:complete